MWVRRAGWLLCALAALEMYLFQNCAATRALLAAVVCLPPALALAALLPRRRIEVSLSLPETARRGEEILCKLTVTDRSRRSLPALRCRVELENRFTGERKETAVPLAAGPGRTRTGELALSAAHSGLLSVGILRAEAVDWFGLFTRPLPCGAEGEVLVLPERFPVELAPGFSPEPLMDSGEYSSQKPGRDPSETFRIREYVPGDPVRQIHWKLSEKTGKTLVRDLGLPLDAQARFTLEAAPAAPEEVDAALDLLFSAGRALAEGEVPCAVGRIPGGEEEYWTLLDEEDWDRFQRRLLSAPGTPFRLRAAGIRVRGGEPL